VEKILEKEEGKKKKDLGREAFLTRVEKFAKDSHDTIVNQLKSMGASLDWSREAFTLDEPRNLAVRTAFKTMHDLGLIYQGHRVINWDVKGQTTISDDEIIYQEREAKLYTFKYAKDFPISISTTRPETKVGDTATTANTWSIATEDESNTLGHDFYYSDSDGDANVEEAAAATIDMNIT
jgi:valyl-tRNA synthetase